MAHSCRCFEILKITHDTSVLSYEALPFPILVWVPGPRLTLSLYASELCGIMKNRHIPSCPELLFPSNLSSFIFYCKEQNKLITEKQKQKIHVPAERTLKKKISQIFFNANIHAVLFKQRLSFYIGFITVFSVNKEIPTTLFLIAASCFI